jgi:hypothetical protein
VFKTQRPQVSGFRRQSAVGERDLIMSTEPTIPLILPVGRSWFIALRQPQGIVEAFDDETKMRIFVGRYFAPSEYRDRDPRKWSKRTMTKLLDCYGLYGGTFHQQAIFVLAEVYALRVLMDSAEDHYRDELERLPLIDALAEARDAYSEMMCEQASRMSAGN